MSKAEQIVGRLTQEETVDVLSECIYALPDEALFNALTASLTPGRAEGTRGVVVFAGRQAAGVIRSLRTPA